MNAVITIGIKPVLVGKQRRMTVGSQGMWQGVGEDFAGTVSAGRKRAISVSGCQSWQGPKTEQKTEQKEEKKQNKAKKSVRWADKKMEGKAGTGAFISDRRPAGAGPRPMDQYKHFYYRLSVKSISRRMGEEEEGDVEEDESEWDYNAMKTSNGFQDRLYGSAFLDNISLEPAERDKIAERAYLTSRPTRDIMMGLALVEEAAEEHFKARDEEVSAPRRARFQRLEYEWSELNAVKNGMPWFAEEDEDEKIREVCARHDIPVPVKRRVVATPVILKEKPVEAEVREEVPVVVEEEEKMEHEAPVVVEAEKSVEQEAPTIVEEKVEIEAVGDAALEGEEEVEAVVHAAVEEVEVRSGLPEAAAVEVEQEKLAAVFLMVEEEDSQARISELWIEIGGNEDGPDMMKEYQDLLKEAYGENFDLQEQVEEEAEPIQQGEASTPVPIEDLPLFSGVPAHQARWAAMIKEYDEKADRKEEQEQGGESLDLMDCLGSFKALVEEIERELLPPTPELDALSLSDDSDAESDLFDIPDGEEMWPRVMPSSPSLQAMEFERDYWKRQIDAIDGKREMEREEEKAQKNQMEKKKLLTDVWW